MSFINPQSDPLGSGYHIIQSEIAIGSGGAWGKGFLKGTQARLNFLPEQTTDFIFAVYAEEFGFVGSLVLLGLYCGLIARGAWIARHARDRFGSLIAIGFTGIIFWQVAINIGMATGMLPVVGITLPLVSYGGSSLIAMMIAHGRADQHQHAPLPVLSTVVDAVNRTGSARAAGALCKPSERRRLLTPRSMMAREPKFTIPRTRRSTKSIGAISR